MSEPSVSEILRYHGLDPDRDNTANWGVPFDVADDHLPNDFNSSFTEGYAQCDPWMLHRAFQLWDNSLHASRSPPYPDYRFFSIPGYDGVDVKSVADLDHDDAKRVNLIESVAHTRHRDVCFARLTLQYYGPRLSDPVQSNHWDLQPNVDYILGLTKLSDTK
jgi:hypothetical protein